MRGGWRGKKSGQTERQSEREGRGEGEREREMKMIYERTSDKVLVNQFNNGFSY